MPRALDLSGQTFGKLTVESLAPPDANLTGLRAWICRCDCGATVTAVTSRLRHRTNPLTACPACLGRVVHRRVHRVCMACGRAFLGDPKAQLCSPKCREDRRRGLKCGVTAAPNVRTCLQCGRTFAPDRSAKTCSEECRIARKRERWRQFWRDHPEKTQEAIAQRRQRRRDDPEWAKRIDQRKYERTMADPVKHAHVRAKSREFYRRNAERICAERRLRVAAMTDAELVRRQDKMRFYCRMHRRRRRADPVKAELDRQAYREWQRSRQARQAQAELQAITQELTRRLNRSETADG